VVNWSTTRLVLILSALSNLKTRQVDYVQAYTQADFDCDLYMHVPAGFAVVNNKHVLVDGLRTKGLPRQHVLKLKKNLDGLKQAGHNWFEKLRTGLQARGFIQSNIDRCLFLRKDCILVVYVDDCLLFSPSDDTLDDVICSSQTEFVVTSEGDAGAFHGINIKKNVSGHLTLTQPGLIQEINEECGVQENSQQHRTPSSTDILQKDELVHHAKPHGTVG
jgi:hypothetical protein